MVTLFHVQRLSAIAVVTLLLCGCRSSSSSTGVNRVPYGAGANSYSRPYGKSEQTYDNEYRSFPSTSPLPESQGIAPTPGYSEPEDTPAPPTPSAKKSRWNLVPPGFKPSVSRPKNDVYQTGIDLDRGSLKTGKKNSTSNGPSEINSVPVIEETVGSRASGRLTRPNVSDSYSLNDSVSETPVLPMPHGGDVNQAGPSNGKSLASRYGMNRFPNELNRDFRIRPVPSLDPVARPLSSQNQGDASSDGEMPLLLPPGN